MTTRDGGSGFGLVFTAIRGSPRPTDEAAIAAINVRLDENSCRIQAQETLDDQAGYGWPLAYALAWLSVAGGNSVMPPWVRHQFPEAGRLVRRLRDNACSDATCDWCRDKHDAEKELARWFGFPGFRREPADDEGRPFQKSIAEAAILEAAQPVEVADTASKNFPHWLIALLAFLRSGPQDVNSTPSQRKNPRIRVPRPVLPIVVNMVHSVVILLRNESTAAYTGHFGQLLLWC